jgi:Flp pilus assembly protein TadD
MLLGIFLALAGCATGKGQDAPSASSARANPSTAESAAVSLKLARAARAAGDLTSAIQIYRTVSEGSSADPQVLVELGDTMAQAGLYDDAIEAYGRVEGKSSHLGAWLGRMSVHLGLGEPSSARLGALLGLVRAHLALGEAATALQFAEQARALAPQDVRVLVDRGAALDALKRYAEAQQSYRSALQIAPRSVTARNNLALSLALTGQYDQAIAIMEPLARSAAATPKIRENFALILGLSGDSERAAAVSRMDLDETSTAANLAFFGWARDGKP